MRRSSIKALGLQQVFAAPNVVALAAGDVRILLPENASAGGPSSMLPYFGTSDLETRHRAIVDDHGPEVGPPHRIATLEHAEIRISQFSDPSGNALGLLEERAHQRRPSLMGRSLSW